MNLIVHADDFGASKSITDDIVDCFMNGPLTSTSVIANGPAFDYAMDAYRRIGKAGKRLALHVNFLEGRALSSPDEIDTLVDADGFFRRSFPALAAAYYLGNRHTKEKIARQIRQELSAQMTRVRKWLPPDEKLNIDSHQHFHMIPFIFRTIVDLREEFNIGYIRIPRERFVFDMGVFLRMPINLVKFFLLNLLAKQCLPSLRGSAILHPDYFIGVLRTGDMNTGFVRKSLRSIAAVEGNEDFEDHGNNENNGNIRNIGNITVEILFHPGGATPDEEHLWEKYPQLLKFYLSGRRKTEKNCLTRGAFLHPKD